MSTSARLKSVTKQTDKRDKADGKSGTKQTDKRDKADGKSVTKQMDKRDKADGKSVTKQTEKAGQSRRTSVTKQTEKAGQSGRKSGKVPSSFFPARVRNWYCSTSCRHHTDLARAQITREKLYHGLSRRPCRRSFIFQTGTSTKQYNAQSMRNTQKKRHFNWERESGMALEKWDFLPESGNVDT